jgi:hypothetical protein
VVWSCNSPKAWTAAAPCLAGAIRRKQQVPGAARELQLNAIPEFAAVGEICGFCAAQVRGGLFGVDPMFRRGSIDHRRDGCAACFPSPTDVSDLVTGIVGAVQGKDEARAWQQGEKGGFIEQRASNVQCFSVALAQESRELVPCPVTEVRNSPQEFRSAWLNASAVRGDQQTPRDVSITKRNADILPGT